MATAGQTLSADSKRIRIVSGPIKQAWQQLLETGILVQFRILDTYTEPSPDKQNVAVSADLVFTGDDEDTEPSEVAEWGAFGFLYILASLSFHDARPRGYSDKDFLPEDEFTVSDFFECLSYGHDGLHLRADYVHGRCMKTDITVRADGTATLETWGRGQTALRWLDRLQGKKMMGLV
jgi:hypothetical protein